MGASLVSHSTYERLSSQDSSFVMFEHRATHMHVSAVAVFETAPLATADGGLDVGRVSKHIESRLHLIPHYRQRLRFTPLQRQPIWVDDPRFNLHYHVRHASLPRPGSRDALKTLAGRILSQHLDREKPLWEIWLIEGLEEGRFAMIAKVHHCMVDGAAGVNLMTLLLSPSPNGEVEPAPAWRPRKPPGPLRLLVDEGFRRARVPLSLLNGVRASLETPRVVWEGVKDAGDALRQALLAGFQVPADTPLNRAIGPHRRIDWHTLELVEVKDLKKRLDGTINDVVLAIVAGAVRHFLRARNAQPHGPGFRVMVPVNMRSGAQDLAASNQVSGYFLPLPIEEPDPLRRVQRIKDAMRHVKQSKVARGIELMTRFADWSGSTFMTLAGVRLASRLQPYNLIVTNVPGPQFPLYLLGARMLEVYPHLPLFENQGLGVAVMSYHGRISWGLVGDWELLPDLPVFTRAVDLAFNELREAAESL